jgi:hypothetical protein
LFKAQLSLQTILQPKLNNKTKTQAQQATM